MAPWFVVNFVLKSALFDSSFAPPLTKLPLFHWAQTPPTGYKHRSPCRHCKRRGCHIGLPRDSVNQRKHTLRHTMQ